MRHSPWLILDRDDTILDDPGYLSDPDKVEFLPGAISGLKRFFEAGWPLVVVTNQSGLGRGYFSEDDLAKVHLRFRELLTLEGIALAGIYYCPHHPQAGCDCRKPATALAERAAEDLSLVLEEAVVVGDKASDLQLGRNIDARYVAQITAKSEPNSLADGHYPSLDSLADELLRV